MTNVIKVAIGKIDQNRRDFRGQPETLRAFYWKTIREMLEVYEKAAIAEKHRLVEELNVEELRWLLNVAFSGAVSAVRTGNYELIMLGLSALAVENCKCDAREVIINLTLLDVSAAKLGCRLEELWSKQRAQSENPFQELCDNYLKNARRTLESIMYVEDKDKNGNFIYRQNW